jgi:hypothetical protein
LPSEISSEAYMVSEDLSKKKQEFAAKQIRIGLQQNNDDVSLVAKVKDIIYGVLGNNQS